VSCEVYLRNLVTDTNLWTEIPLRRKIWTNLSKQQEFSNVSVERKTKLSLRCVLPNWLKNVPRDSQVVAVVRHFLCKRANWVPEKNSISKVTSKKLRYQWWWPVISLWLITTAWRANCLLTRWPTKCQGGRTTTSASSAEPVRK